MIKVRFHFHSERTPLIALVTTAAWEDMTGGKCQAVKIQTADRKSAIVRWWSVDYVEQV